MSMCQPISGFAASVTTLKRSSQLIQQPLLHWGFCEMQALTCSRGKRHLLSRLRWTFILVLHAIPWTDGWQINLIVYSVIQTQERQQASDIQRFLPAVPLLSSTILQRDLHRFRLSVHQVPTPQDWCLQWASKFTEPFSTVLAHWCCYNKRL